MTLFIVKNVVTVNEGCTRVTCPSNMRIPVRTGIINVSDSVLLVTSG